MTRPVKFLMIPHRTLRGVGLGVAVLLSMAATPLAAATDDDSFFTHLHTEKAMANVTVSPGRAGPVDSRSEIGGATSSWRCGIPGSAMR